MKEKRKSNKTTFIVLTVALALVAILVAVKVTHTPVNNVSIGWIEHKQSDLWEADYSYFTGTQTSNLQSQKAKLNIDVKTDEGSLEISIKDADDNTIFSETIFYKGIMPSEKILDLPVDCNFLTGSVNL